MRIAAITEDGQTISQHFGRAPYYLVVTIVDQKIVQREIRSKLGHAHFSGEMHDHPDHAGGHAEGHGLGPQAQDRHNRMAEAITDCEVLLCRGMGRGAYESMKSRGIRPIVTDIETIDDAVQAVVQGAIVDLVDRLH